MLRPIAQVRAKYRQDFIGSIKSAAPNAEGRCLLTTWTPMGARVGDFRY